MHQGQLKIQYGEMYEVTTLIEFKNVTKAYPIGEVTIQALAGVDFSILEGIRRDSRGQRGREKHDFEHSRRDGYGYFGTSVCGDQEITGWNEKRLTEYRGEQVGFVFQFYNLIPNLNALENVEFATEVCKDHLDARDILHKVGLTDRLKNFPSQLSGGEQQRVAIARAVAKNPALLCDEPTGALDYVTGKSVLKLLQDLNRETKTCVVLVTHNSAIAPMADKVIRVKSGIESITINDHKQSVEGIEW